MQTLLAYVIVFALTSIANAEIVRVMGVGGTEPNGISSSPSTSTDGRYVAFESLADNLVLGDTNGVSDIFVYDRQTGEVELVSVGIALNPANGASSHPSISGNGADVIFESNATNLVWGETNGVSKIYIWEGEEREMYVCSKGMIGDQANGDSHVPSFSANGSYLAFESRATNLVPGVTNGYHKQIFSFVVYNGETTLLSRDSFGIEGDGDSFHPSCQDNGFFFVAFSSDATNLVPNDTNGVRDVFLSFFDGEQATRIGVGNNASDFPSTSVGGRYVAFESLANDLVPGDTNGVSDVFVSDQQTGLIQRVSDTGGTNPSITNDGHFVTFEADSLTMFDRLQGTKTTIESCLTPAQGNLGNWSVSNDGRFVTFSSDMTNLVPNDTNGVRDVFLWDRDVTPLTGSVNAGAGPVVKNILAVNGRNDSVIVRARMPITVSLASAPLGPSPTNYVVWVWANSLVQPTHLIINSTMIGCTANPTPFTTQTPQPFLCLRGNAMAVACRGINELPLAPSSAPWTVVKTSGFRPSSFILQGLIYDNRSSNQLRVSITNSVILEVR